MQNTPQETDDLFHYTSADIGVFNILAEGRLRLGPYESTNDLRESKQRYVSLSVHEDDNDRLPDKFHEFDEITNSADWWLRRFAKVACFTRDFEMPSSALDNTALRGWAHPSLWAHYGGAHSGVSLRFSRATLVEAFVSQLGSRGQAFAGNVQYPFDAWPTSPWGLDLGQVREFGIDAVLSKYVSHHKDALFFTKHHDWANESEFRLVLNEPSVLPAYLDVSECITGVFFGDAFPKARLDAAFEILSNMPRVEPIQLLHFNGLFRATRSEGPGPRPAAVARRTGDFAARYRELGEAEARRQELRASAQVSTAELKARCYAGVQGIAQALSTSSGMAYEIHPSIRAVPDAQRGRAAGVPGEVIEYEFGSLGVASASGLEGRPRSFVFAAAVQVLGASGLRFHGEVSRERITESGNEIETLWTTVHEAEAKGAESQLEILLDAVTEQAIRFQAGFLAFAES